MSRNTPVSVALGVLELFIGVGAMAGGGALALVPDGDVLQMPLSLLAGSPFQTYFIPGLLLFTVVGGANTLAGFLTIAGHSMRKPVSICAGVILIGWISMEVALLGYLHWAQPLYFGLGLLTILLTSRLVT